MNIALTPEQWEAFGRDVADDPEKSVLQMCCGNISALRGVILQIQSMGGWCPPEIHRDLAEKWEWCRDSHAFDDGLYPTWKTLRSLIEQAGLPPAKEWR